MGRPLIAPILSVDIARVLLISALLAACAPAAAQTKSGVFDGQVQASTFAEVKQAIDDLYTRHPGINSFVVRAVTYTPKTRDKVLKICSEGGLAASDQEREAQKVLACAPLIFFFYSYGQQSSVPESVGVARQLYWFAMRDKSDDSKKALTGLLRSWGMQ